MSSRHTERYRSKTRIGADAARAWVREFKLHNPYAKSILMAVANYMNETGVAWPGLATLAQDTDINEDTVASRLNWCESIGLIHVLKCWVDEHGRRNYEKRGRPTSSEIRFLFDADLEDVEDRARAAKSSRPLSGAAARSHAGRGVTADETAAPESPTETGVSDSSDSEFCPRPHRGPASDALPPASPGVAPEQPPTASVRSVELEQEDSPLTPLSGGDVESAGDREEATSETPSDWPHAESWAKLKLAWADPISSPDICQRLWSAFSDAERERFIRVVRGYLAWRLKQPKLPMRMNLQKLMRARDSWPEYEKLAGPDPALRTFIVDGSREHHAMAAMLLVGGWTMPPMKFDDQQGQKGKWINSPLKPDELAMAQFFDKPIEQWAPLERGTKPFYAWNDRMFEWFGQRREQLRVPCLFPPRKDGSIGPSEEATGPPADTAA